MEAVQRWNAESTKVGSGFRVQQQRRHWGWRGFGEERGSGERILDNFASRHGQHRPSRPLRSGLDRRPPVASPGYHQQLGARAALPASWLCACPLRLGHRHALPASIRSYAGLTARHSTPVMLGDSPSTRKRECRHDSAARRSWRIVCSNAPKGRAHGVPPTGVGFLCATFQCGWGCAFVVSIALGICAKDRSASRS